MTGFSFQFVRIRYPLCVHIYDFPSMSELPVKGSLNHHASCTVYASMYTYINHAETNPYTAYPTQALFLTSTPETYDKGDLPNDGSNSTDSHPPSTSATLLSNAPVSLVKQQSPKNQLHPTIWYNACIKRATSEPFAERHGLTTCSVTSTFPPGLSSE